MTWPFIFVFAFLNDFCSPFQCSSALVSVVVDPESEDSAGSMRLLTVPSGGGSNPAPSAPSPLPVPIPLPLPLPLPFPRPPLPPPTWPGAALDFLDPFFLNALSAAFWAAANCFLASYAAFRSSYEIAFESVASRVLIEGAV